MKRRRVVVTGIGIVSSLGIGWENFWPNLIEGASGINKITLLDTVNYDRQYGGEIKDFDIRKHFSKRSILETGRTSQLAILATHLALRDAKLFSDIQNIDSGLCFGTTMGQAYVLEEINKRRHKLKEIYSKSLINCTPDSITRNIAYEFDLKLENVLFTTACSAGNYAIGYAYDVIAKNCKNVMIAGGADAMSRVALTGFSRLFAVAPKKCMPFDKNRQGMLVGEGSAALILEEYNHAINRKAEIYAEILGYGLSCDGEGNMTIPHVRGMKSSMQKAMYEANVDVDDVDYISAHGTGTKLNDSVESKAINEVFNHQKIPVSSIKSMLGHTMGAASAIEASACCLAIKNNVLPPTINYATPDPECDIDCVPNFSRESKVDVVLNNSSAFGGNNSCLVLGALNLRK